jgi:hypothetical protein
MIEYVVKTPNEEDPAGTVVEKHGDVVSFSFRSIAENTALLNKRKRELEATIELNGAKMKNVEDHHPFVKEFTGEQKAAAYLYAMAEGLVLEATSQLKAVDDALKVDADETAEILKQLPELAKAIPKVEAVEQKQ